MGKTAIAVYLARLPFEFLTWWFIEAPTILLKILIWIFSAFVHLFAFKSLFTTFFKPWKNEYREGLVKTAIFIGAFFKSLLIIFDVFIFGLIIVAEIAIFLVWFALPAVAIYSLYGAIFS